MRFFFNIQDKLRVEDEVGFNVGEPGLGGVERAFPQVIDTKIIYSTFGRISPPSPTVHLML